MSKFKVLSSNKQSSCIIMLCSVNSIKWLHEDSQADWGHADDDEGADPAVQALVKRALPDGVTFKMVEDDRVILKAYSKKRSADNTSYVPRQITIKRSNYDDDSSLKLALDMNAKMLLKKIADEQKDEDLDVDAYD